MEKRSISENISFEKRMDEGETLGTVSGYAAIYSSRSVNLGGFVEVLEPGAFSEADLSDVVALFNHDNNYLLARNRNGSGSLELSRDNIGLKYSFELANTTAGRDLAEHLNRGDIYGSSFSFRVGYKGEEWEEDKEGAIVRHITKIGLVRDVSPVVFPAYEATDVAKRSFQEFRETLQKPNLSELYALKMRLIKRKYAG